MSNKPKNIKSINNTNNINNSNNITLTIIEGKLYDIIVNTIKEDLNK